MGKAAAMLVILIAAGSSGAVAQAAQDGKGDKLPIVGWTVREEKDPLTDVPMLMAMLVSIKDDAALAMMCKNGHTALLFSKRFTHFSRGGIDVATRINSEPPVRELWNSIANGEAIGPLAAENFISSLPDNGTLFVRAQTRFEGPADATFQLGQVSAPRSRIAAACHWSPYPSQRPHEH